MKKYHKTKGACLLLDEPQLYCNIRALNEGTQVESSIDGTYVYPDDIYPAAKKKLKTPTTPSGGFREGTTDPYKFGRI